MARRTPSTQSVQATDRYQVATGHQIDPGVIALVTTGDVYSANAERRVHQVEAQLRAKPRCRHRFELLRQSRSGQASHDWTAARPTW